MDWFIGIDNEFQILYYIERPNYSFKQTTIDEKGRKKCQFVTEPIWVPINLELPTRLLPKTENWLKSGTCDIILKCSSGERVFEDWLIKDAYVHNKSSRKSRVVASHVINIIVKYTWAKKGVK